MLENLCRVLTFHERRAPNELSACALSSLFCLPLFVLQCSQIGQGFCCEVTQFLPSLWGWPSQASPQDAARGFGATEPRVPCAWGDSIWEHQCGLQQHAPGEAHACVCPKPPPWPPLALEPRTLLFGCFSIGPKKAGSLLPLSFSKQQSSDIVLLQWWVDGLLWLPGVGKGEARGNREP